MIVVTSGLARGPGSHSTTHSSTGSSMIGTSSTRKAPSVIAPRSSCVAGRRSASVPPSQYPTERPARTTPMSAPQTKSELPKYGARTRLAASSIPSSTAPEVKTAMPIARVCVAWTAEAVAVARGAAGSTAIAVRVSTSGLYLEAADEARDVLGPHDDGVDAGALELDDLLARLHGELRDRELPGRDVRQQPEDVLERLVLAGLARGEQQDLRVEPVEREPSSSSSPTATTHSRPARAASSRRSSTRPSSSSSSPSASTTHASAPAAASIRSDIHRIGSSVASRSAAGAPETTRPSAPARSAACAVAGSSTTARSEIPSPSEMAWLRRRPGLTSANRNAASGTVTDACAAPPSSWLLRSSSPSRRPVRRRSTERHAQIGCWDRTAGPDRRPCGRRPAARARRRGSPRRRSRARSRRRGRRRRPPRARPGRKPRQRVVRPRARPRHRRPGGRRRRGLRGRDGHDLERPVPDADGAAPHAGRAGFPRARLDRRHRLPVGPELRRRRREHRRLDLDRRGTHLAAVVPAGPDDLRRARGRPSVGQRPRGGLRRRERPLARRLARRLAGLTELLVSHSRDGVTWEPPVAAARTVGGSLAYDKEWLVCDSWPASRFRGRCYLGYTDVRRDVLAVQTSPDGGTTWRPAVTAGRACSRCRRSSRTGRW